VRKRRPPDRPSARQSQPAIDWLGSPANVHRVTIAGWAVIALLAIVLLGIARGPHRVGAYDVESDFYGGYGPAAIAMQHGHIVDASGKLPPVFGFVGPLYPALLALGGRAIGNLFDAAELLSVIACVAVVLCWFLLLRRRANAGLALVVVMLLATNPLLVRYGYSVTTDATALALQSAALLVLFTRRGKAGAAVAGLLAGLAALTRYNSVYLLPAGLIAIAMGTTLEPRRKAAAAWYVIGFLAPTLPWQIYGRLHGAEIQFHQLLAFDVYANATGMDWDTFLAKVWPQFEHAPLAVLTADPGAVAQRMFANLGSHLWLDAGRLLGWPVAACAAAAPLLALRDRRMAALAALALPGAWAFLVLVPAAHNERYSLAVLPFYLLLAGAALTSALWPFAKRRAGVLLQSAVVIAVVAFSLVAAYRAQVGVLGLQPLETIACADTLRQLAKPDDSVIARKPNLAFEAGVAAVYFPPFDSLATLARYAEAKRARWMFVSVAEALLRPDAAYLLDSSATVPGLTLRAYSSVPAVVNGSDWRRVAALYEIGPGFGTAPAWLANDTLRTLHTLRGMACTLPSSRIQLELAAIELMRNDLPAAQAAWRRAARIDPRGMTFLLDHFQGDTLTAVARGQSIYN
jgi:Dolichyl-phosphate-mannose-protein mannosyltransferase